MFRCQLILHSQEIDEGAYLIWCTRCNIVELVRPVDPPSGDAPGLEDRAELELVYSVGPSRFAGWHGRRPVSDVQAHRPEPVSRITRNPGSDRTGKHTARLIRFPPHPHARSRPGIIGTVPYSSMPVS